MAKRKAN